MDQEQVLVSESKEDAHLPEVEVPEALVRIYEEVKGRWDVVQKLLAHVYEEGGK